MRRLLPLLLLASSLAGCAAPSMGQGTTSITVNLSGARFRCGAVTTLTITTTPTSEGKQDAKADGKVDLTVPLK